MPMGFVQQLAAGFDSRMISASIAVAACGFATVAKFLAKSKMNVFLTRPGAWS